MIGCAISTPRAYARELFALIAVLEAWGILTDWEGHDEIDNVLGFAANATYLCPGLAEAEPVL